MEKLQRMKKIAGMEKRGVVGEEGGQGWRKQHQATAVAMGTKRGVSLAL